MRHTLFTDMMHFKVVYIVGRKIQYRVARSRWSYQLGELCLIDEMLLSGGVHRSSHVSGETFISDKSVELQSGFTQT